MARRTQAQKFAELYLLLREELGAAVPARQLLRLAIALQDALEEQEEESAGLSPAIGRSIPDYAREVDSAMSENDGWHVLRLEARHYPEIWDEDPPPVLDPFITMRIPSTVASAGVYEGPVTTAGKGVAEHGDEKGAASEADTIIPSKLRRISNRTEEGPPGHHHVEASSLTRSQVLSIHPASPDIVASSYLSEFEDQSPEAGTNYAQER